MNSESTNIQQTTAKDAVELISDKWSIEVLHGLRGGANRYGELQRAIPKITKKMLTQTLRKLERNGIVERIDYEENPPRVEYFITSIGDTLIQQLTMICKWSKQNFDEVQQARESYDENQDGWI